MKKRKLSRMLTAMLSSAMIAAQMGAPISVMAAGEEIIDVICDEDPELDDDIEEIEEDYVEVEVEDTSEHDNSECDYTELVQGNDVIKETKESHKTSATAQSFMIGQTIEGALESPRQGWRLEDKDYYSFELDEPGVVTLVITSYVQGRGYDLTLEGGKVLRGYRIPNLFFIEDIAIENQASYRVDKFICEFGAGTNYICLNCSYWMGTDPYGKYVIETSYPTEVDVYPNTLHKVSAVAGNTKIYDGNHTLKLETDEQGNFKSAAIYDANGNVDTSIDSYIANIVIENAADFTPKTFYSLVFTDGKWDTSYDSARKGPYTYDGEKYFVAGGVVNQNANSLIFTGDAGWKFLAAGRVVTGNAGLVMYQNDWFWIDDNGNCDDSYASIVNWNGGQFFVHGGRLRTDFTGFAYDPQNPSKWYHITNGQVWGDGMITDQSIEGGLITRNVVGGVVQ